MGECTPEKHKSDFKFMVGTSAKKSKELSKKRSKEVIMGSSWELAQQKRAEEHTCHESLHIPRLCEHEKDLTNILNLKFHDEILKHFAFGHLLTSRNINYNSHNNSTLLKFADGTILETTKLELLKISSNFFFEQTKPFQYGNRHINMPHAISSDEYKIFEKMVSRERVWEELERLTWQKEISLISSIFDLGGEDFIALVIADLLLKTIELAEIIPSLELLFRVRDAMKKNYGDQIRLCLITLETHLRVIFKEKFSDLVKISHPVIVKETHKSEFLKIIEEALGAS